LLTEELMAFSGVLLSLGPVIKLVIFD
jgi:hypothetical protein